ncbi:hypothetical protein RO3G_01336 [Rhizopus delemar RA 99-880]|uniref:Uncharacterized protein n=1 Tax=Rhizopus delemar (strain RA 99-880 / ATCC MYA-4621 / FGSC 9543 / NRRL 43880) TaxID=246409 RepID=I1BKA2_RHIO9|nr:hypothetical protein RO3G_01336 [Rhizopus delemar RA 99-880]|eukprot:EIE76632.1 hypothetical protein RO3G_01336 [Rhizopus delemar RA 99-880]
MCEFQVRRFLKEEDQYKPSGCTVNKTVIEQPNGKFIIKYRGEHILDFPLLLVY